MILVNFIRVLVVMLDLMFVLWKIVVEKKIIVLILESCWIKNKFVFVFIIVIGYSI